MKISAIDILLAVALVLGFSAAAGAGELTVTRQKDGTLLITNMGIPKDEEAVPEVKEGATVKEIQAPAVVQKESPVPEAASQQSARVEPAGAGSEPEDVGKARDDSKDAPPPELSGAGSGTVQIPAGPGLPPPSGGTGMAAAQGMAAKPAGEGSWGEGGSPENPGGTKVSPAAAAPPSMR